MGKPVEENARLRQVLCLITKALDLIDEDGSVGTIGAHLDLARARLTTHLEADRTIDS